ncbi:MAG: nucleotidyltransferase domain-containing protein [Rickettsiaceae bacterium]|nr:MAG: nucleotidyltransferase domain-containing protein [Rickettsiaceae bacterium]
MTPGLAKQKLAMIILFGSYARGNWAQDEYIEQGITYSYQSDLDKLRRVNTSGPWKPE